MMIMMWCNLLYVGHWLQGNLEFVEESDEAKVSDVTALGHVAGAAGGGWGRRAEPSAPGWWLPGGGHGEGSYPSAGPVRPGRFR